ncbi:NACHT, LRR and PYD domains-containing protein 3-like [Garra rufa]|uniref:NACHT, LRR and PYD domains-containing protein 3-like n=1 Tax=Garra rufa TaxID=137080 RepID=UPI003CCE7451
MRYEISSMGSNGGLLRASSTTARSHELMHSINLLFENEFKRFKILLSPDPACTDKEIEDNEDQKSLKEWTLKITLHMLRKKNQMDLANILLTTLISVYQQNLKSKLKEKFEKINEGISNQGCSSYLNEIYTEVYITEGGSGEVNNDHEVRQIETATRKSETQEIPIKCNDIFKPLPEQDKPIRTVLTKGVAGIGKTVSVQKVILDWAEEKANRDVHFIFPLPFRELNLLKQNNLSLKELLCTFFKEIKELPVTDYNDYRTLFIFDGLDECRLNLNFRKNQSLSNVTESASVDVLLTNLIKGNLLPSALLWITSRPAAANQIPSEYIDQVTEIRGFTDPQKDEYFRKRINDQNMANRIITHVKLSRSLYIMCHIPVFCWIAASVLERMLIKAEGTEIPKTLTQMFTHFLIFQTKLKNEKYDGKYEVDFQKARKSVLSLGKLAFQQLERGNLIFYEEDLLECGIDVKEASVYSGVCTQIFREEFGLYLGKVYSFVHLSIQEFLAALFMFLCFVQEEHKSTINDALKKAVDKALQSENGHLDLYLRFLLGLSLESNQSLLRGLLTQAGSSCHSKKEIVEYIKMKIRKNPSSEQSINLLYCLNELNDDSLVQEVQTYVSSTGASRLSGVKLTPAQWSALVFVLLNSEEDLEEFKLSKYDSSEECLQRMLPVVKASRKADLSDCNLTEESCSALVSVLTLNSSSLKDLNLSNNELQDSKVNMLSTALESKCCKLEILRLDHCSVTEQGCAALFSALWSNTHLRELNLSRNKLGASGVKQLSKLLKDSHCKLEKIELSECSVKNEGCADLTLALRSNISLLKELILNGNELGDSGVKVLCDGLKDSHCKLEKIQLANCSITEKGCDDLASALRSNTHLREINLSWNKLEVSGVNALTGLLKDPKCKLEKLNLSKCSIGDKGCGDLASALQSDALHLRELDLSENMLGNSGLQLLSAGLKVPHCKLEKLLLENCSITEGGCKELALVLRSNSSHLKELSLSNNELGDLGVKHLSDGLNDPNFKLEKLHLENCSIKEQGCLALSSALKTNPLHLRELNLSWNELGDSAVKELSELLEDPHCKLEKLQTNRECQSDATSNPLRNTSHRTSSPEVKNLHIPIQQLGPPATPRTSRDPPELHSLPQSNTAGHNA